MKHNEHAPEWQQVDSVGEGIIGLPVPNDAMSAPLIAALVILVLMICAHSKTGVSSRVRSICCDHIAFLTVPSLLHFSPKLSNDGHFKPLSFPPSTPDNRHRIED